MSDRRDVLITVDELKDALAGGEAVQVLDVRWGLGAEASAGRAAYLEGHIPGARYCDLETVLTGPTADPALGRHPLPGADQLAAGLGALGIHSGLPVVVYDEPGSFAAGRAWWTLRWAGLDARVLDGGLPAWVVSGGELETGEVPVEPTTLALTTGHMPTITADEAEQFPGTLIDARTADRFQGLSEPIDPMAGHIPGAVNRPVPGFFAADGTLPDEQTVRNLLALPSDEPVAVYCGSGVSACQLVLALASVGVDAALYPPSWSGWSSDLSRPVAVGD
ncbi:sulfurtransferase [Brooklawnia cerclae]|uniref:Thiosulfate/3-mercaptopyruvate sulfurtransferase n=1 Tax=Brooklawnia cerclae TaxID=349934 RepID=A0ABX0SBV6_9ACTN|nr:sulfurtransferase [Brooklawnia cerclae]NIH55471.1 thiosulfate/3-mercaptopyruvate sulfurtransferase [Brooklawnia cerclae]